MKTELDQLIGHLEKGQRVQGAEDGSRRTGDIIGDIMSNAVEFLDQRFLDSLTKKEREWLYSELRFSPDLRERIRSIRGVSEAIYTENEEFPEPVEEFARVIRAFAAEGIDGYRTYWGEREVREMPYDPAVGVENMPSEEEISRILWAQFEAAVGQRNIQAMRAVLAGAEFYRSALLQHAEYADQISDDIGDFKIEIERMAMTLGMDGGGSRNQSLRLAMSVPLADRVRSAAGMKTSLDQLIGRLKASEYARGDEPAAVMDLGERIKEWILPSDEYVKAFPQGADDFVQDTMNERIIYELEGIWRFWMQEHPGVTVRQAMEWLMGDGLQYAIHVVKTWLPEEPGTGGGTRDAQRKRAM